MAIVRPSGEIASPAGTRVTRSTPTGSESSTWVTELAPLAGAAARGARHRLHAASASAAVAMIQGSARTPAQRLLIATAGGVVRLSGGAAIASSSTSRASPMSRSRFLGSRSRLRRRS